MPDTDKCPACAANDSSLGCDVCHGKGRVTEAELRQFFDDRPWMAKMMGGEVRLAPRRRGIIH